MHYIFGGKTSSTQERVRLRPILIHWTLTHTHPSFHPTELYWSLNIFWQQHTHTHTHVFIRPDYISVAN